MITLAVAAVFAAHVSHWCMMFFFKSNLGSEKSDRSFDKVYKKVSAALGFTVGFVWLSYWATLTLQRIQHGEDTVVAAVLLGLPVYALGFALRLWAIRTLGRLFTFEIGIRKDHRVISEGPFRWLRHPSYTGYFFMALGLCIQFSSVIAALSMLLPTIVFFSIRIPAEERMLAAHFGPAYIEYQKNTWRFFPGIY